MVMNFKPCLADVNIIHERRLKRVGIFYSYRVDSLRSFCLFCLKHMHQYVNMALKSLMRTRGENYCVFTCVCCCV